MAVWRCDAIKLRVGELRMTQMGEGGHSLRRKLHFSCEVVFFEYLRTDQPLICPQPFEGKENVVRLKNGRDGSDAPPPPPTPNVLADGLGILDPSPTAGRGSKPSVREPGPRCRIEAPAQRNTSAWSATLSCGCPLRGIGVGHEATAAQTGRFPVICRRHDLCVHARRGAFLARI